MISDKDLEDVLRELAEEDALFFSIEELVAEIFKRLKVPEGEPPRADEVAWRLVKKHWALVSLVIPKRGFDIKGVVRLYMKRQRRFPSIKSLARLISRDTGMSFQTIYTKLLLLAEEESDVGNWLKSLKETKLEPKKRGFQKILELMAVGVSVIPLDPEIIGLSQESLDALGALIKTILEKGYKIRREKSFWVLYLD